MKRTSSETMKYGYLSRRERQNKKYGKEAKRQLALAIAMTLMLGSTPAWAENSVLVTTRVNGSSTTERINSGNILVIDNTTAKISNTDSSISPNMMQFTKGEDDPWSSILAGYDEDGKGEVSSNNTITITGTTVSDLVEGGRAKKANDNHVTLDNVTYDYVYGGEGEASASSNTVTLLNGSTGYTLEGGQSNGGNADGNTVTVTGSTVNNMTMGGMASGGTDTTGHANGNTVTLDNSSSNSVYGGFSLGTDASSNRVELKNGSTAGTIYGGMANNASTGSADKNTVILTDSTATSDVYGGFVQGTGTASENSVTIENSTVEQAHTVAGGYANDAGGDIKGNTLTLSGNTSINADFTAAGYHYSGGSGNPVSYVVSGNKLLMNGNSGETLKLSALNAGGLAMYGNAENNELNVSDDVSVQPLNDSGADEVKPQLYGGASVDGNATGNKVTISTNGKMNLGTISGGSNFANASDGSGLEVKNNSVIISSGEVSVTGSQDGIRGGTGEGTVSDNTVTITGGTVNVLAADIAGGNSKSGDVIGNKVTISGTADVRADTINGGSIPFGYKGYSNNNSIAISTSGKVNAAVIEGGFAYDGSASNNNVSISNGTVSAIEISGGFSTIGTASDNTVTVSGGNLGVAYLLGGGTTEGNQEVNGNTITLSGGTIDLYTGTDFGTQEKPDAVTIIGGESNSGTVKDNIINLNATMDLSKANLYGWHKTSLSGDSSSDTSIIHSGNTLNVNAGDIKVGSLNNFDVINFGTVPWVTDGSVLTLVGDNDSDLSGTTVDTTHISFTNLASIASAGDYAMNLLNVNGKKTGLTTDNLQTSESTWDIGNALIGTGKVSLAENGNVVYKMNTQKVESTENTHHALIANEAVMGALNSGRDRLEGVLDGLQNQGEGTMTFASIGGGRDRYDTGSDATTHMWNGVVGIGNDTKVANGDLSYGVFYEYGKGNYDTSDEGLNGSGDMHYNGGGLMGKFVGKNKTYVEGSLRFGQVDNDADSVLHNMNGTALHYKTSQNYWAGHIGVGHIFDLTDEVASESRGGTERAVRDLDVYGKYFHTHLGGDDFTAGDVKYDIDSMNSDLLRIGARVNNRSDNSNLYYGLAWDYEFDGESTGRVSAAGLSAPIRKADIGGSSLMAEAGWKLEATPENPWEVNLSLKAYAGQHEGLGGSLWAAYHF